MFISISVILKVIDMEFCVYCHTNTVNGKKYVGITKQKPTYRWQCGKGYRKNVLFYRAIKKYGWDSFTHDILASGLTEEEAKKEEVMLIRKLRLTDPAHGYNITAGGDGTTGYKHTEEAKAVMSEKKIGTHASDETRKKISISNTGKKRTEEQKAHYSESAKKRDNTASTQRLYEHRYNRKGAHNTEEAVEKSAVKRAKPCMCIETGKIYLRGASEASRDLGLNSNSAVRRVCEGVRSHVHGYHFRYLEAE